MAKDITVGKRTLIGIGGSLALTLPPEWIKKQNLKAGDEVTVVDDGILQIVPPAKACMGEIEVHA